MVLCKSDNIGLCTIQIDDVHIFVFVCELLVLILFIKLEVFWVNEKYI